MKISPNYNCPGFGSIYANYNADNMQTYMDAFIENPEDHKLKPYATRIFRELPTQLALAKVLDTGKSTSVKILGSSDGSEAYAYAITLSESFKDKAKGNIEITAVDREPFLTEMGKTGYLVCTDKEKFWANNSERSKGSPLKGSGWDKYLTKTGAPANFESLCKQYPILSQITRDTVSGISIGRGMDWYKVNQENLPEIKFVQDDMRNHLSPSPKASQQVYVVANSLGYLALEDLAEFTKVFEKIQNNNHRNSSTYLVLGDLEHQVFRQVPQTKNILTMLGFEPVSKEELSRKGVDDSDRACADIWKLKQSGFPIKIAYR